MGDKGRIAVVWVLLRLSIGFIFFWAFLDKTFGLGFSTSASDAWFKGGSPTYGFLQFGASGPLQPLWQALAGNILVDWLFMLGLFGVGIAFLLGIAMRLAAVSGALMMFLIYLASLWPKHNPLIDEHIIYVLVLLGLGFYDAGREFSLYKWWQRIKVVQKFYWLK